MSKTLHSFNAAKHLPGQERNSVASSGSYLNAVMTAVVRGFIALDDAVAIRHKGEEDERQTAHIVMDAQGELQIEITPADFAPREGSVFVIKDYPRFTAEEVHQIMSAKLAGSYRETVNGKPSGAMFKPLVFGMFAVGSWYQSRDGQWILASDFIGEGDDTRMVDQYDVQRYCYSVMAGRVAGLKREAMVGDFWPGDIVPSCIKWFADDVAAKALQGRELIAKTEAAAAAEKLAGVESGALAGTSESPAEVVGTNGAAPADGQGEVVDTEVQASTSEPESVGSESLKNGMENFGGIGGGA